MEFINFNHKYIYYSIYFFDFLIKDNTYIKDYKNITDDELKLLFTSKIYNEKLLFTIFDVIRYVKNIVKTDNASSVDKIINGSNNLNTFMNKYKRNVLEIYQYFYEKNLSKNKKCIDCSVYESSLEYKQYDFYRKIMKEWQEYIDSVNMKYIAQNIYWC
jgi:hypothetical protein